MSQNNSEMPQPSQHMQNLNRLVGTWAVSGGVEGRVTYEWMEGQFFLLQHVDFDHDGRRIKGMEVIGHEQPFGEAASEDIKSRFYDTLGNTFDYVYEIEDDTLTIWGGEKGSPAFFRGTFSENGNSLSGSWVYPGGGGYDSTMTRIK